MTGRALLRVLWIWGPVLAYLAGIFYLSGLSSLPWASAYPDTLEHALEYAGLAVLLARALNGGLGRPVPPRLLLLAFALCVLYGATDELHQRFVPDRYADITDVLGDAAGAGLGLLALDAALRILPWRRRT